MGGWNMDQEQYDQDPVSKRKNEVFDDSPIQKITIDKGKSGLGLSIVAAKGSTCDFSGIYVQSVIKGSIADQDGRVEAGDLILSVNENSLIDCSKIQAAKFMTNSGPNITLEIFKQAAFYHGLEHIVKEIGVAFKKESTKDSDVRPFDEPSPLNTARNGRNASRYEKQAQVGNLRPALAKESPKENITRSVSHNHTQERPRPAGTATSVIAAVAKVTAVGITDTDNVLMSGRESERSQPQVDEGDYDSDGNLMTPEYKARKTRERQRMLEYEERYKAWRQEEEERLRAEAHEASCRKHDEPKARGEVEVARIRSEEEERFCGDKVRLAGEKRQDDVNRQEDVASDEEPISKEQRRLQEQGLEKEGRSEQQTRGTDDRKLREERRFAEEIIVAETKGLNEHRLAEQRLNEQRLAEQRLNEQRLAEQRKTLENRQRAEQRKEAEEKPLAKTRIIEERRLVDEHDLTEEWRLAEECSVEEYKAVEEKRLAEDRRLAEERRADEERRIRERERLAAEEQTRTSLLQEEQRVRREELERKLREEERIADERRKQEKRRLAEMRQQRERTLSQWKLEQGQVRAEEEARDSQLPEARIKSGLGEASMCGNTEGTHKQESHSLVTATKVAAQNTSPLPSERRDTPREMGGMDEALREAERIAAEMDLLMVQEERKIEEEARRKKEAEKREIERQLQEEVKRIDESLTGKPRKQKEDDVDGPLNLKGREFQQDTERQKIEGEIKRCPLAKVASQLGASSTQLRSMIAFTSEGWSESSSDEEEKVINKLIEEERREREAFDRKLLLLEQDQQGQLMSERSGLRQSVDRSKVETEFRLRLEVEERSTDRDVPKPNIAKGLAKRTVQSNPSVSAVRPQVIRILPASHDMVTVASRSDVKVKSDAVADHRRPDLDASKRSQQTADDAASDDEDAPPRPPPPRCLDTSVVMRSPSVASPKEWTRFNFATSRDVSPPRAVMAVGTPVKIQTRLMSLT